MNSKVTSKLFKAYFYLVQIILGTCAHSIGCTLHRIKVNIHKYCGEQFSCNRNGDFGWIWAGYGLVQKYLKVYFYLLKIILGTCAHSISCTVMSSSWNFTARASPSCEDSEPSRAELGHFNFRAETELTILTICMSKNSKF